MKLRYAPRKECLCLFDKPLLLLLQGLKQGWYYISIWGPFYRISLLTNLFMSDLKRDVIIMINVPSWFEKCHRFGRIGDHELFWQAFLLETSTVRRVPFSVAQWKAPNDSKEERGMTLPLSSMWLSSSAVELANKIGALGELPVKFLH